MSLVQLEALQQGVENEDWKATVAAADSILQSHSDPDALKCKAIALLHLSDFKGALDALSAVSGADAVLFEKAYALYRSKEHAKVVELCQAIPESKRSAGLWHVEAQACYRLGDFGRSIEIYERHLSSADVDIELRTNLLAALVSSGQSERALSLFATWRLPVAELTYEAAYNAACAEIDAGDFAAAIRQLEMAEGLARSHLSADGLSAEEVEDEVAAILVQRAFVLQLQGHTDRANDLYKAVITAKPSDSSVSATASNNLVALRRGDEKVFDSLKRSAKALLVEEEKLSPRQKRTIGLNRALLLLHGGTGKHNLGKAKEILDVLGKTYPDSEVVTLALAALHWRSGDAQTAEEILRANGNGNGSIRCRLASVHLTLARGDIAGAATQLQALLGADPRPALVATLVAMHERANDVPAAANALNNAVKHWTDSHDPQAGLYLRTLLEASASFHASHRLWTGAADAYQALLAAAPLATHTATAGDQAEARRKAAASLVLALAQADANRAQQAASKSGIVAAPSITQDDLHQVENAPAPRLSERRRDRTDAKEAEAEAEAKAEAKAKGKGKGSGEEGEAAAGKKRRKRKPRYPKGFDPANPGPPPDPHRWKPRWEREALAGKKSRRKRQDVGKGAQGATSEEGAGVVSERDAARERDREKEREKDKEGKKGVTAKYRDRAARRRMKKM